MASAIPALVIIFRAVVEYRRARRQPDAGVTVVRDGTSVRLDPNNPEDAEEIVKYFLMRREVEALRKNWNFKEEARESRSKND